MGRGVSHHRTCPSCLRLSVIAVLPLPDEMADVNFRKIDIDAYDEDALVETELYDAGPRDPGRVLNDVKQKATAVRSALSKCHYSFLVPWYGGLMGDSCDALGEIPSVL